LRPAVLRCFFDSNRVLKLGHGLDTAHPNHKAIEHMKQRLEALSGGAVTIDIYPISRFGSFLASAQW